MRFFPWFASQLPSFASMHCLILVAAIGIGLGMGGCSQPDASSEDGANSESNATDRVDDPDSTQLSGVPDRPSPSSNGATRDALVQLIQSTVALYQNASAYSDRATGRLRYSQDGEMVDEAFPMRTEFRAPNRIAFRIYDTQATSANGKFFANLGIKSTPELARQVLVRTLPTQLSATWLAADETLLSAFSDGIAGPPPQFDLLLGSDPMSFFTQPSSILTELPAQTINGVSSRIIQAENNDVVYRLGIGESSGLFTVLQLPFEAVPNAIRQDRKPSDVYFAIEFNNASLDPTGDLTPLDQPASPAGYIDVRQWIIPPPPLASDQIGQAIGPFGLTSLTEAADYQSSESKATATVICWLSDSPASEETVKALTKVQQQLVVEELSNQVDLLLAWLPSTDAVAPSEIDFSTSSNLQSGNAGSDLLPSQWGWQGPIYTENGELGEDRLSVREAPTTIILDRGMRLQVFDERLNRSLEKSLMNVLRRIVDGEDLATRLLADTRDDNARYIATLRASIAETQNVDALPALQPFPPSIIELTAIDSQPVKTQVLASAFTRDDIDPQLWFLLANGKVVLRDGPEANLSIAEIENFSATATETFTIVPGPKGTRKAVIYGEQRSNFWYLDGLVSRETEVLSSFDLNDRESVTTAAYLLPPGDAQNPVLTVATNQGRQLLIDSDRQIAEGNPQQSIVAVIPVLSRQGTITGYQAVDETGNFLAIPEFGDGTTEDPESIDTSPIDGQEELKPKAKSERSMQLPYQPLPGYWIAGGDGYGSYIATLADDLDARTSLVMLDYLNRPLWSYPVSSRSPRIFDSITDPKSGQMYWLIESPGKVLHFVRRDNLVSDQVCWNETIRSANLNLDGEALRLTVVFADRIANYAVTLPKPNP
jgi:hypothetical protein